MTIRAGILVTLALLAAPVADAADCTPLRVGYMDQDRPPYWLGEGEQVPEPPGAGVDLIRDAVAGAGFGCPPTLVRLPAGRLKVALAAGDIDVAPLGDMDSYPPELALPRDRNGNVDLSRAMGNTLMVLVRSADALPPGTDLLQYFHGKVLGAPQGAAYVARLRVAGLTIDDGARDLARNIVKLKLRRVDGVVVSLVAQRHLAVMLARYHGAVIALPRPLLSTRVWLAFNQQYYLAHRERVEALWTWLDVNRGKFSYVMRKYRKPD